MSAWSERHLNGCDVRPDRGSRPAMSGCEGQPERVRQSGKLATRAPSSMNNGRSLVFPFLSSPAL
jgi:hypothetical protein